MLSGKKTCRCEVYRHFGGQIIDRASSKITGEHVAEFRSPESGGSPFGIPPEQVIGIWSTGIAQPVVHQYIGINDDHSRPSRLYLSISSGVVTNLRDARNFRAFSIIASTSIFRSGTTVASRTAMTSLFRLRLWRAARDLSARCRAGGRDLSVMEATVQPLWLHLRRCQDGGFTPLFYNREISSSRWKISSVGKTE